MIVVGKRFGRLIAVAKDGRSADGHITWLCKCDCGQSCTRQSNVLKRNGLASCGCAARDVQVSHGMRGSREYASWRAAKDRCHNQNSKDFHRYGARGIVVCDAWRESFEAFFEHMGHRPEGTTLERVETNGNYEPGNCVWATPTDQARNRRNSIFIDWAGKQCSLSDVAVDLGITYGAAFMRFKRGKLHDYH